VRFRTKPQIALAQIQAALAAGIPQGIVAADAGYGNGAEFRDALTEMGLRYAVGVLATTRVWAEGRRPLPPPQWSGHGRPPTRV
jgi:SRSO17 transposase